MEDMNLLIFSVTNALVREHLSKKKLKETYHVFVKEQENAKDPSISGKSELVKKLGIHHQYKAKESSGKTILEILVTYFLTKSKKKHEEMDSAKQKGIKDGKASFSPLEPVPDTKTKPAVSKGRNSMGKKLEAKTSTSDVLSPKTSWEDVHKESGEAEKLSSISPSFSPSPNSLTKVIPYPNSQMAETVMKQVQKQQEQKSAKVHSSFEQLQLDDVESDEDVDMASLSHQHPLSGSMSTVHISGEPISLEVADSVRKLLFGQQNGAKTFPTSWRGHGFFFHSHPKLSYGLVQKKGGPCGLLASVQSFIIKHLFFESQKDDHQNKFMDGKPISESMQRKVLLEALEDIIWQSRPAPHSKAILVIDGNYNRKKSPGLQGIGERGMESLELFTCLKKAELHQMLEMHFNKFYGAGDDCQGITNFLYSVIITRGVSLIQQDMDQPSTTLLGMYGYCTQELVHLLCLGQAISNVFDNDCVLDDASSAGKASASIVMKGIKQPCPIGHLSLYEHYQSLQVGQHLKNPLYPIYIICSESHYTVLFSPTALPTSAECPSFDMYYYDGLANQQEEIRLTIDSRPSPELLLKKKQASKDPVSPIEFCIKTKWKNAFIDWNGTDPLL